MAEKSKIEWTEASWNPVTGCTKVSPGCDHCYAETFAERWRGIPGHHFENGFDVTLRPERLDQPVRWRKPRRIFVNSMSDLFHDQVPDEFIAKVFAYMAIADQHTFQLLTKRHARMRSLLNSSDFARSVGIAIVRSGEHRRPWKHDAGHLAIPDQWPLPNLWLGVSVENQKWADIRIPALLDTPAAVRWLSCEPLLGPVDLSGWLGPVDWPACWGQHEPSAECPRCIQPDWVVVGGESGPGARPLDPDWARQIRDQCAAAHVPMFFKQWGEHVRRDQMTEEMFRAWDTKHGSDVYHDSVQWKVGKKAAGRLLDGRTHDEYPTRTLAGAA